jgi:hypothetical protein
MAAPLTDDRIPAAAPIRSAAPAAAGAPPLDAAAAWSKIAAIGLARKLI